MSRVRSHPFVPKGQIFLMADMEHPEMRWFTDDVDQADGTIVLVHPDDEVLAKDVEAQLGERYDVNTFLTQVRRRQR